MRGDDSSGETEYLENLTQEYWNTEKKGSLISVENLKTVTQDIIWCVDRIEKFDQVIKGICPLENIEGLKVKKVNIEVGGQFPIMQNKVPLNYKFYKIWSLKSKTLLASY